MTWIEKLEKVIDLAVKAEAHAFAMIAIGAGLTLHGYKDEGQLVIGAALAVFKSGH